MLTSIGPAFRHVLTENSYNAAEPAVTIFQGNRVSISFDGMGVGVGSPISIF